MPKVWRFSPHDESCVRELSRELRISPLLAQVLISRGYATGALAGKADDTLNWATDREVAKRGGPSTVAAVEPDGTVRVLRTGSIVLD